MKTVLTIIVSVLSIVGTMALTSKIKNSLYSKVLEKAEKELANANKEKAKAEANAKRIETQNSLLKKASEIVSSVTGKNTSEDKVEKRTVTSYDDLVKMVGNLVKESKENINK